MKKISLLVAILILFSTLSFSQDNYEDSINTVTKISKDDSVIVLNHLRLAFHFVESDSLKVELYLGKAEQATVDDEKLCMYYNRNEGFVYRKMHNNEMAVNAFKRNLKIAEKNIDTISLAYANDNIASTHFYDYKYEEAIFHYKEAAKFYWAINDKLAAGRSYNNAGIMYEISNHIPEAIELYLKAIKIYEDEKNYEYLIGTTSNIGLIYIRQERYSEAVKYYEENLHYLDSVEEKTINIDYYLNFGIAYDNNGQLKEAEEYFKKAYITAKSIDHKKKITTSLTNLATNANLQKNYQQAIKYNLEALELKKDFGDLASISISQLELGTSYYKINKYSLSKEYYHKALENALAVSYKDYIQKSYLGLSSVYNDTKEFDLAYEYLQFYTLYKDSILSEENNNTISELKEKYEADKKLQQIAIQKSEIEKQKANVIKEKAISEKKAAQRNMVIIGLVLMAFLAVLILYFLKQKHKANTILKSQKNEISNQNEELNQQNEEILTQRDAIEEQNEELKQFVEEITTQRDEIENQKEIIEEIHHEVSQSIDYATRLQESILPEKKILKKYTDEHFVLFLPKDKVSGDFYWWTHVENQTIITAADCTGHGVPGAFMSMLGVSFLREIVQKEYVTHTGVILRKLRKEIVKSLKQTGESGTHKDGMDMALISINQENNMLQFSGANNPLYIIRNEELSILKTENSNAIKLIDNSKIGIQSSSLLYEVKPDKMPIAIYEKMDKFQAHEIQLEKGDQLYMFSDGFPDQFGGPKGKKFKYTPLKKLLIGNAEKPMEEQKDILYQAFIDWKGVEEQVDDIVILGIKI